MLTLMQTVSDQYTRQYLFRTSRGKALRCIKRESILPALKLVLQVLKCQILVRTQDDSDNF